MFQFVTRRRQLRQPRRGVLVHVDSVATEAIPARAAHKALKDMTAEATTSAFDTKWGKPDPFLSMTYTGLLRHTHEIGVIL